MCKDVNYIWSCTFNTTYTVHYKHPQIDVQCSGIKPTGNIIIKPSPQNKTIHSMLVVPDKIETQHFPFYLFICLLIYNFVSLFLEDLMGVVLLKCLTKNSSFLSVLLLNQAAGSIFNTDNYTVHACRKNCT